MLTYLAIFYFIVRKLQPTGGAWSKIDGSTGPLSQFKMTRDKISVNVCLQYALYVHSTILSLL